MNYDEMVCPLTEILWENYIMRVLVYKLKPDATLMPYYIKGNISLENEEILPEKIMIINFYDNVSDDFFKDMVFLFKLKRNRQPFSESKPGLPLSRSVSSI